MVINMGGAPAGAEDGTPGPRPPEPGGRTRRDVARGLRAAALAAALAPALTAFRSARPGPRSGSAARDTSFDVSYRGHHIRGVRTSTPGTAEDDRWHVTVDGRPLHLMRRADGTWLSMVDHYCSYGTPLEAARAAVDALGPGRRLRDPASAPTGTGGAHEHAEGRHGVRA
ncbi:tyrosinase family oxidase copper chaperone [Streptomyces lancefieldiae]|uniref:Tyrosinase family oxidase copper chaperone n=1 Tax=Streptomyces lancefieldiae TaxID=3075520 RepID=A0ABU3ARL2_9ACTN|nr:tyrosinase family oxidase copper chaperone [Streptomyces sp. DSM 40712]MDT0612816.1 tyrosinase family oxidase copper chaperone [Streptomyces sp. DSM 40712]